MKEIIIPSKYLEEDSLSRLYTSTVNNFDTLRDQDSGRVQVVRKIFVPAPNNNYLTIRAETRSSAKQYNTRIAFTEVEYVDENTPNVVSLEASDGQQYQIVPISYNNGDAKVSCDCLDFYYRFAVWNHREDSLLGDAPPPYVKKTDSEPVNPDRVPGLCKHLIALTTELRNENIIR